MTATTAEPTSEVAPPPAQPPARPWRRHPADAAHLVLALAVVAALTVVALVFPDGVQNVSADVVNLVANLPRGLTAFFVGVVQLVALVAPVAVVVVLVWRRQLRLLGLLALAAGLAAATMVVLTHWLGDTVPRQALTNQRADSWVTGAAFPSSTYLAALAAAVLASSTAMASVWRRWAWGSVAAIGLVRLLTATEVPVNLLMVVAIGAAAGAVAVLILGAPARRVDTATIEAALQRAGIQLDGLVAVEAPSGVLGFRAPLRRGGEAFVKVIGREERDGDLVLRWWRSLRVKGLGDDRPTASPRRVAEHEVLVEALCKTAGVSVPTPLAVTTTDEGAAVIAEDWVEGRSLSAFAAGEVDDVLLHALWREVRVLQDRRIAHRALDVSNVRVSDGHVVLVDLRLSDLAAADEVLGADVAELLASLTLLVGVERTVAAAAAELGPGQLARALPLLQPVVLTPATRDGMKQHKGLLGELQAAVQTAAGVEAIELAKVHRITVMGTVTLVGSVVLGFYLLSLAANWRQIWAALTEADWTYVPWILVAMVLSYTGGAISMMGSVPTRLPFLQSNEIMFAQAFLNRFTPANAGGMALRARYLQLQGTDLTVAATAVGLTSAASGVVQVVFIVLFFVWGGTTDAFSSMSMPKTSTILLLVVAVAAVAGLVVLSAWGRRVVMPWVRKTIGKVRGLFATLGHRPDLLTELFGGAAMAKLATIVAFFLSIRAFGIDMSFAEAGALYMVGNTIGSAVPTPGGVGGIEAALTAVLISAGVDGATAAAIVLLFRLVTYWLPTIPGWLALDDVKRRNIV